MRQGMKSMHVAKSNTMELSVITTGLISSHFKDVISLSS